MHQSDAANSVGATIAPSPSEHERQSVALPQYSDPIIGPHRAFATECQKSMGLPWADSMRGQRRHLPDTEAPESVRLMCLALSVQSRGIERAVLSDGSSLFGPHVFQVFDSQYLGNSRDFPGQQRASIITLPRVGSTVRGRRFVLGENSPVQTHEVFVTP
jgi:hypothetical protein